MPKLQQTYINDPDKQVRIILYRRDQPSCIVPARLEGIFMRGADLLVDGPTVPAEGTKVQLALGYPEPILIIGGEVTVAHPTAEGSHAIWIQFSEYCRGKPLHEARDLIRALR
jgi:hypothetical protein